MGQLQFYGGKLLFKSGKLAMDPDCCCGQGGVDDCRDCLAQAESITINLIDVFNYAVFNGPEFDCSNPLNGGTYVILSECKYDNLNQSFTVPKVSSGGGPTIYNAFFELDLGSSTDQCGGSPGIEMLHGFSQTNLLGVCCLNEFKTYAWQVQVNLTISCAGAAYGTGGVGIGVTFQGRDGQITAWGFPECITTCTSGNGGDKSVSASAGAGSAETLCEGGEIEFDVPQSGNSACDAGVADVGPGSITASLNF